MRLSLILRKIGLLVKRNHVQTNFFPMLSRLLEREHIDLFLDVGANQGQFVELLREEGFAGEVISFEPLEKARLKLQAKAEKDGHWKVAPLCAIGDREGEVVFNESENSQSSSILSMLSNHVSAAPESKYIASHRVPLMSLDKYLEKEQLNAQRIFLKIDVQGFEENVLEGIRKNINRVHGICLEMSVEPFYEGQKDYIHGLNFIQSLGFSLRGLYPDFSHPETGELLQFDAVFVRKNAL